MINIRLLRFLFEKKRLYKLLLSGSFLGLLSLIDFLLFSLLSPFFGPFLILSIIAAVSGLGLYLLINQCNKSLDIIHKTHKRGYKEESFYLFIGLLPSLALLIVPGLFTNFFGFILLIQPVRRIFGQQLTEKLSIEWEEIYEYFYILYK